MKKARLLSSTALLALMMVPAAAHAAGSNFHRAQVLDVVPIQQITRVSSPHQECWNEQHAHRQAGHGNTAGLLVGGVAGGVIGNRFGGGNGKKIATVAGTLAGAMVGSNMSRGPDRSYTTTERRCQTVDRWYDEERTVGYRVKYAFRGDTYWTEMDHAPGDTISVRVDVTPTGR